jgi:hypothetical protein
MPARLQQLYDEGWVISALLDTADAAVLYSQWYLAVLAELNTTDCELFQSYAGGPQRRLQLQLELMKNVLDRA